MIMSVSVISIISMIGRKMNALIARLLITTVMNVQEKISLTLSFQNIINAMFASLTTH